MDTFRYLWVTCGPANTYLHLLYYSKYQRTANVAIFVCFVFVYDSLVIIYEYSDNLIGRMPRLICD
jgi:hypothetical protein